MLCTLQDDSTERTVLFFLYTSIEKTYTILILSVRRILIEPGNQNRKNDCFSINNGTNQCLRQFFVFFDSITIKTNIGHYYYIVLP